MAAFSSPQGESGHPRCRGTEGCREGMTVGSQLSLKSDQLDFLGSSEPISPTPGVLPMQQSTLKQKRRERTFFTDEQLQELRDYFEHNRYPRFCEQEALAQKLNLKEDIVRVRPTAPTNMLLPLYFCLHPMCNRQASVGPVHLMRGQNPSIFINHTLRTRGPSP